MFRSKNKQASADDERRGYSLDWPSSTQWNSNYEVPRNSLEAWGDGDPFSPELENGERPHPVHAASSRSLGYARNRRDFDISGHGPAIRDGAGDTEQDQEEFSHLKHWLETLSELYMNQIDNRARWEPRWMNVTRRERFEGLASASVTVMDYFSREEPGQQQTETEATESSIRTEGPITSIAALAAALQTRPEDVAVRVILVSDLSRFVMGALGHLYSVDPEFWFEHLANSGYSASDSGLKLKNAVWMNWAERETRFRHKAQPGPGQPTEWNLPRRMGKRSWAHMRWGRLGLLHYLGRKGFHEDEIEKRLQDGRWMMERDVALDKHGLLMTTKRQALTDKELRNFKNKEEKEIRKIKRKEETRRQRKRRQLEKKLEQSRQKPTDHLKELEARGLSTARAKTTNVYRAYSTFAAMPKNPDNWFNRDLRVMAPEGISHWSGVDKEGKKTSIVLFDPVRKMQNVKTRELFPSLTFMPRPMELESYTDEEWWRTPNPGETFLDPPPPPLSKRELRKQKQEAKWRELKEKKDRLQRELKGHDDDAGNLHAQDKGTASDVSSDTSDSEYDAEYEDDLRSAYKNARSWNRERDFARKYALATHDLVCRYLQRFSTAAMLDADSPLPSVLARLSLDDSWQLLSELRLDLDHLDGDFGADLHVQLLSVSGVTMRQNLNWMRSTLQELSDWASHLSSSSTIITCDPALASEIQSLLNSIKTLQTRTDSTLNLLVSTTGLSQSSLVIDQTDGINKLTELAFLFVPLSFITSVFSMQVREVLDSPPPLWTWGLTLSAVLLSTYFVRVFVRSPSVRLFAAMCRSTIINRFTSTRAGTAARRFNTLSTRAVAKFALLLGAVLAYVFVLIVLASAVWILIFGGLWLGGAAVALYFLVTRWPQAAVLAPCFVALVVCAVGMWLFCFVWKKEMENKMEEVLVVMMNWIKLVFPEDWLEDRVDDDDLAVEGVRTYARQAMMMAT